MKIAVFGGTGGTGRQIIEQALDAGHQISALGTRSKSLERSIKTS